jgi:hypothetical protein
MCGVIMVITLNMHIFHVSWYLPYPLTGHSAFTVIPVSHITLCSADYHKFYRFGTKCEGNNLSLLQLPPHPQLHTERQ